MPDKQTTGPGLTTTFPFTIADEFVNTDLAEIRDNQIIFIKGS